MPDMRRPLRILHVVGGMGRGGAEMWLMHMLRGMDRSHFRMDFLVHTEKPCAFDEEIRALGSQVIPCMHPHQPLVYAANFRRIAAEHGPYDIVHSAVHHFSGYVLRLAAHCGIPGRIAHSHNSSSGMDTPNRLTRRLYFGVMEHWVRKYATAGLACSSPAAAALFGENWLADPRWRVHYPSTDLSPFRQSVDRASVRVEFGIPEDAFVIGHVGRFDHQKNHPFVIAMAEETLRQDENAWFLLVGDGPRRTEIQQKAAHSPYRHRIVFAGSRSDVPRLMLGAMDVFALPSLHEGLPLVLVEAQAAGLPVIISDVITPEAGVVKPLVSRLSLSQSAAEWAAEMLSWRRRDKPEPAQALAEIAASPFHLENAKVNLARVYLSALGPLRTAQVTSRRVPVRT
ncbi:MAG TPA: glycosyltransferase [bacterium]|jgi:glycosyltransferase involved in cell wall biosynthesis